MQAARRLWRPYWSLAKTDQAVVLNALDGGVRPLRMPGTTPVVDNRPQPEVVARLLCQLAHITEVRGVSASAIEMLVAPWLKGWRTWRDPRDLALLALVTRTWNRRWQRWLPVRGTEGTLSILWQCERLGCLDAHQAALWMRCLDRYVVEFVHDWPRGLVVSPTAVNRDDAAVRDAVRQAEAFDLLSERLAPADREWAAAWANAMRDVVVQLGAPVEARTMLAIERARLIGYGPGGGRLEQAVSILLERAVG
jgi:hypothetical protein